MPYQFRRNIKPDIRQASPYQGGPESQRVEQDKGQHDKRSDCFITLHPQYDTCGLDLCNAVILYALRFTNVGQHGDDDAVRLRLRYASAVTWACQDVGYFLVEFVAVCHAVPCLARHYPTDCSVFRLFSHSKSKWMPLDNRDEITKTSVLSIWLMSWVW